MDDDVPARRAIRVCLVAAVDKTDLLAEDDVIPYDYKASGQIDAIVRLVADSTAAFSRRSMTGFAVRVLNRFPGRRCIVLSHRLSSPPPCVHDDALLVQTVDDVFAACASDTLYVIGGPDLFASFLPYASVFYKFVLGKSVRLAGGCQRRFVGPIASSSGVVDTGPRVDGAAGLFYHLETWSLASTKIAPPPTDSPHSHFLRIRKPRRDFRLGCGAPDDGDGDAPMSAISGSSTGALAHIPDVGVAPLDDVEFASDMDQAIIQSQYEYWIESRRPQATTEDASSRESGGDAMHVDDHDATDETSDCDVLALSDADDFILDVDLTDDDSLSDSDDDNSSDDGEGDGSHEEDGDDDDGVILYDGEVADDDARGVDMREPPDSMEPVGCIVARVASYDLQVAWNILGRLRPADVFSLARASPTVPRIMAAILDTTPIDVVDRAWPQPPDDPMWSASAYGTTVSPNVARVGTAWLMLVGMGARLWPMSPLQARFDPTLRTAATSDYWKKYVDPATYASMLGCAVVVYECVWLSVQQYPNSDYVLPAVPLAAAAALRGSLAVYNVARMVVEANILCGRAFTMDPPDRNIGYGGTLNMLDAVVAVYARDMPPTQSARHLSAGQHTLVLTAATRDFVDAVRDNLACTTQTETAKTLHCIDTICSRQSAWIVRQCARQSCATNLGGESTMYISAAIAALGRIVQVAIEQAADGCTGIRSAVAVPFLQALTATKGAHTDAALLDALNVWHTDTTQSDRMAITPVDMAPPDDLLYNLLDHEPMLFTTAILPHLDDRDVLALGACSRSLLHAALVWFAARRRKTTGVDCAPLVVDHIDQAGPPSEGLALGCLWLPWIEAALDLVERAALACCPDKDQPAVEPRTINTLLGGLWRSVKRPTALILATVERAIVAGTLHVLPTCVKALDRLCAAHHSCSYVSPLGQLDAYKAAVIRCRGDARRAVSPRDPPPIRLLAWMQANTMLVDDDTSAPTADVDGPDKTAVPNEVLWRRDVSAGNACSPITAFAYAAGRLRSSRLLALAAEMADEMRRGALFAPCGVAREEVLPFALASSGEFVPLYDHGQPPAALMDVNHAYLRAAALGVRHGPDPSIDRTRIPSTSLFLDELWTRARLAPAVSHGTRQAEAPMAITETVGLLLLTTTGDAPDARQIRSAGLAMLGEVH
ncbi:Dihydrofolate reductase incomplete domain containing protein [Pandoravirus salinus]|uniref:Dihydrofolate reductase incomplete domain containing protein n=1 Tax=Pandoravirus salinus TaxID=1349410 RepID=S4VWI3_9VIRU|nr:Dihydrofolate reductase incomplete domain [Pandoravirus salinus]AGO84728.1 Dihydrofolate reductase incomplete domain containing protein [Pandoravirus salinus]